MDQGIYSLSQMNSSYILADMRTNSLFRRKEVHQYEDESLLTLAPPLKEGNGYGLSTD